jgi:hypothetical protein
MSDQMQAFYAVLANWDLKAQAGGYVTEQNLGSFMTDLGAAFDQLSVEAPAGSDQLILYSGDYQGGKMWHLAEGASHSGQGFYYAGSTEAGKLLAAESLKNRLYEICNYDQELVDRIYGLWRGRRRRVLLEPGRRQRQD